MKKANKTTTVIKIANPEKVDTYYKDKEHSCYMIDEKGVLNQNVTNAISDLIASFFSGYEMADKEHVGEKDRQWVIDIGMCKIENVIALGIEQLSKEGKLTEGHQSENVVKISSRLMGILRIAAGIDFTKASVTIPHYEGVTLLRHLATVTPALKEDQSFFYALTSNAAINGAYLCDLVICGAMADYVSSMFKAIGETFAD